MSYELRTTSKFERLFKKLPEYVQRRILSKSHQLSDNPYQGKYLHGPLKGKLSFDVGDYRIIYEIMDNTVYLLGVGHRKKIYERLEK
jgi:mRNA interferase RelE/StbE